MIFGSQPTRVRKRLFEEAAWDLIVREATRGQDFGTDERTRAQDEAS